MPSYHAGHRMRYENLDVSLARLLGTMHSTSRGWTQISDTLFIHFKKNKFLTTKLFKKKMKTKFVTLHPQHMCV